MFGFSKSCLSLDKFSPGIKVGINLSHSYHFSTRFSSRPSHHYPIGMYLGVFNEIKISKYFSLINELYFVKINSKTTMSRGIEPATIYYNYYGKYLRMPVLIKMKSILFGFDLGYLLYAKYNMKDIIDPKYFGSGNITDKLPSFDASLIFGITKKISLKNSFLLIELRYLLGLTKYIYYGSRKENQGLGDWRTDGLGEWKNNLFQALIGFQF